MCTARNKGLLDFENLIMCISLQPTVFVVSTSSSGLLYTSYGF
jgi:hypothetical protein